MTITTDRKETEIGMIPQEWEVFSVKDCIEKNIIDKPLDGNHGNIHPTSTDYVDTGIPFVMASDLENGKINFESCHYITKNQADNLQKGFSKNGDILLSHKATIGKVAIVDGIENYVMLTPQVTYYRVKNNDKLNNKFLYYYFLSSIFQDVLNQWAGTGSTRSYIGITEQQKLPILLPPLPEQEAIATTLGSLDDKIELLREQNKTLETIGQAMFKSWFVDFEGQKFMVESELGMIPKGWKVVKLIKYVTFERGIEPGSKAYTENYEEGKIAFFKVGDLLNDYSKVYIDIRSAKGKIVNKRDILVSFDGTPGRMKIGIEGAYSSGIRKLISKNKFITNGFLYFLFMSNSIQQTIERYSKGTTILHAGESIDNMYVVIPEKLELLNEFNLIIGDIFDKILNNNFKIQAFTKTRDNILPRLMSGKIRVI